jgi:cell division control protein 6
MRARASGERRGNRIGVVYIDCSQDSTETQAACSIARGLNEESSTGIAVPRTGLGRSHYYARLWDILDQRFDAVIIILDEIDRLKADDGEDNILMQLSRAREAGKTSVNIGIIGISNKINYRDRLNERVKSSFGDDELVFNPYDANQLRQIMEARRDAFVDGVIEEGVISKAAALAAREHGDARKAIRILRNAGEFAERNGFSTVREEHLDAAQKRAEVDRLQELLSGSTPHTKYALMGLATLTANNPEDEFRTSVIYDAYRSVCADAGSETLTLYRVRDLLREQSFLEIIESYHTGGGRGGGSYTVHQLLKEPEIVFECVDTGAEDE